MKKELVLTIGAITSLSLLLLFGALQHIDAKFLKLPVHWLAIVVLPVLFALFIGGFLTRFKGLGIEIEAVLRTPVDSLSLTASDAVADIPGDEKRSLTYLDGLPNDKKLATKWLLFTSGRTNSYTVSGITKYLENLPNIEYFEIRSDSGDIICFIPITVFRDDTLQYDNIKHDNLRQLIDAIEDNNVMNSFPNSAITLRIRSDQKLVDSLRTMRAEKVDFAAVVAPSGKYLGVVFANEVERRIADSVLATTAV